jgi:hypothetical protein
MCYIIFNFKHHINPQTEPVTDSTTITTAHTTFTTVHGPLVSAHSITPKHCMLGTAQLQFVLTKKHN